MPWEKTFDVEVAVDQATEVFWAKGYHSASLADLLDSIGINKGSFYNAFGSKHNLFVRSLMKYDCSSRQAMLDQLRMLDDPNLAVEMLFDVMIEHSVADRDKKGCFLVNTALNIPNLSEEVGQIVKDGFADFEAFFADQLRYGKEKGIFEAHVDVDKTAKQLISAVVGIRVLSRGVFERSDMCAVKQQVMESIRADNIKNTNTSEEDAISIVSD